MTCTIKQYKIFCIFCNTPRISLTPYTAYVLLSDTARCNLSQFMQVKVTGKKTVNKERGQTFSSMDIGHSRQLPMQVSPKARQGQGYF